MPYVPMTDAGPPDYTDRYNTVLTPEEEAAYQQWTRVQSQMAGRDLSRDNYDYDTRGFWKSGGKFDDASGHGTDRFKKPNHPSFSTQSQYHGADGQTGGVWEQRAGQWIFTPGPANLQMHGPGALQQYFQQRDPGVQVILPSAPQPQSMLDYVRQQTAAVEAEDLMDLPTRTAKIPKTRMRDTPYYVLDPPDVGNEKTTVIQSDKQKQEAAVKDQIKALNFQIEGHLEQPKINYDRVKALQQQQRAVLDSQTMRGREILRSREADRAVPGDVEAIMSGIDRRRAGRR